MCSSCSYFEGEGRKEGLAVTSLCPALGKKHSVIRPGICPSNLQKPHGKEIPISVIRKLEPYVISYIEEEGAEFQIMNMYASKFGFTPKFKMASSFDSEGGLIDMVGKGLSLKLFTIVQSIFLLNRLIKKIVKLE